MRRNKRNKLKKGDSIFFSYEDSGGKIIGNGIITLDYRDERTFLVKTGDQGVVMDVKEHFLKKIIV